MSGKGDEGVLLGQAHPVLHLLHVADHLGLGYARVPRGVLGKQRAQLLVVVGRRQVSNAQSEGKRQALAASIKNLI